MRRYGHGMRRGEDCVERRTMGIEEQGKRRGGRLDRRWLDSVRVAAY